MRILNIKLGGLSLAFMILLISCNTANQNENDVLTNLRYGFMSPPMEAHPGVYWYFMDGNLNKEEITKDLESMKKAGMSHAIFLEVDVGVPRGKIDFMSDEWLTILEHIEKEARRLEVALTLGVGPGWTGSGGPWVKGNESMRHMVASVTKISGGRDVTINLPIPEPNKPFFGTESLTSELKKKWSSYYEDIAVLAFPAPKDNDSIQNLERKSLVYRYPFTSDPRALPFIPKATDLEDKGIGIETMIELTSKLDDSGQLNWNAPAGDWIVLRFVSRNNGAVTRPAPLPGVGFEADKFDTLAMRKHLDIFPGKILERIKPLNSNGKGGLKMLHMDSWEMGSQNWTDGFRKEFRERRGYDPLPYYPAYMGFIVENRDLTERFLWDLRKTSQELILEYHAEFLKKYAHNLGLGLSIEPYDMNPASDLMLGSVADVPMAEFWTNSFDAHYAVIEAASIAHVNGKKIVPSEAFTSDWFEKLNHHPGSLKNIGDWAFAGGVNRMMYHTFAHQALGDSLRPGMTMGRYGVHWHRGQTWWPFVKPYHEYIARCSYMLQQGQPVSDILFMTPEGVPHAFEGPPSALSGKGWLKDKKGFGFDGVPPEILMEKATVVDGKIKFKDGASYELLVLPNVEDITPELLSFIKHLIMNGARVIGNPYTNSPSLMNYPHADQEIRALSDKIWGGTSVPDTIHSKTLGKGKVYYGGPLARKEGETLYPSYKAITDVLKDLGLEADFAGNGKLRYAHRRLQGNDIYFVSNTLDEKISVNASFRVNKGNPTIWNPITGSVRDLPKFTQGESITSVPLIFEPYESYFIVFDENNEKNQTGHNNFYDMDTIQTIEGPWKVEFDPKWGGPKEIVFEKLEDWSQNENEGIKFYSGIASYTTEFHYTKNTEDKVNRILLNLGDVEIIGNVELNGKCVGTVWTDPWQLDISEALVDGKNKLKIVVANQWANRMIGDENYDYDGVKGGKWPEWLLNGKPRPSKRYTFSTYSFFKKGDTLNPSGLIGPVKLVSSSED